MQARQRQLVAQLAPKALRIESFLGHATPQFGDIDLVLLRHRLLRLVHRRIVNTNTGITGLMQLGLVIDQTIKHLAA